MNSWGIFWITLGVVMITSYIAWIIVSTKALERGVFDGTEEDTDASDKRVYWI